MSGAVFAGQMRRRVTLQTQRTIGDIAGFQPRIYVSGPQVWVHIKRLQMSARFAAERREGVVTHEITLRAISNFAAGYRFVFGARVFEVLSFESCEGVPLFIRAYCEEIQT